MNGGQVLNPLQSNQFLLRHPLFDRNDEWSFLKGQFARNHGNQLFSGLLQAPIDHLFQSHVSKFGFEDGSGIGTSAMPGRDADDIASRAVALLERTDAGEKAGAAAGSRGARASARPQAGPGLTQPRSPRNDLMPA